MKILIEEAISMKKVLIAPICLVILLFACQANEDDLFFVGESEHWASNLTVYQIDGSETYRIGINYKKSVLKDIGNFKYYVKTKK